MEGTIIAEVEAATGRGGFGGRVSLEGAIEATQLWQRKWLKSQEVGLEVVGRQPLTQRFLTPLYTPFLLKALDAPGHLQDAQPPGLGTSPWFPPGQKR